MEFSKKEVRDGFTYTFHFTVKGHCRSSVKLCNLGEELVESVGLTFLTGSGGVFWSFKFLEGFIQLGKSMFSEFKKFLTGDLLSA